MSTPSALLGFFRQEAGEYLDGLDLLLAGDGLRAPDGATFLAQARALRGAATMTRLGGLPELTSTLERVAAGLRDAELRWDQRLHFAVRGAVVELRALIAKVERWTDADQRQARTHSVALAAVAAGYLASLAPPASPASAVIPIARLFPDDGAPGLVERAPNPPVSLAERFRNDMAAAADGVARESANLAAGERGAQQLALTDALRRTLLGLSDVAESFGATSIASLSMRMARSAMDRPAERIAIQAFAQLLMDRELSDHELAARVREHGTTWPGGDVTPANSPRLSVPRAQTPPVLQPYAAAPAVAAPSLSAPSAPHAGAAAVKRTPGALPLVRAAMPLAPTPTPAASTSDTEPTGVVAIESLLYSGTEALVRARAVRDELRRAWENAGGAALDPITAALIDELSDLLDLASAR